LFKKKKKSFFYSFDLSATEAAAVECGKTIKNIMKKFEELIGHKKRVRE